MVTLRSRQVHLDFHTSEHIPGVGARFNRKQWQAALKAGRVDSITIFAKCHHSWSYYPTRIGRPHPALARNLLKEQIDACHEIGVRCPIYYTIGWSANDAEQHPDWVAQNRDGSPAVFNVDPAARPDDPRPIVSWKCLYPAREYLDLILRQTQEICDGFDVDGLFYDICFGAPDWSAASQRDMAAAGLDPQREEDVQRYNRQVWLTLMERCNRILHDRHPDATVFYNGAADMTETAWRPHVTHFELEDLPTTWGGYDKFPLRAKYFANSAPPTLAMSGKFHTMWGEFGGFKHPDALTFEAAAMISFGARCSFGDQLHPSGEMDMGTYRNIGRAYRYAERVAEYGLDGWPYANLGVFLTGGTRVGEHGMGAQAYDQGVVNMLLEAQIDFEVAAPDADWSRYRTIVLTGGRCLDETLARKFRDFVAGGGSLLVLFESALDSGGETFLLDVGADYVGPAAYALDYLVAGKALARHLVPSPFLNYTAALRVKPRRDTAILAGIREPFFNRTYARYCSHQNTPNRLEPAAHPAAIRKGRVVYLAHPVSAMYYAHGARVHRDYFINALRLIYRQPVTAVDLPSAARINLVHQPERSRYVLHLLYGPPQQRGRCSVIEDLVPLHDIPVRLRVPERIRRVSLPLDRKTLRIQRQGGVAAVTVPRVQMHQIVVFEY